MAWFNYLIHRVNRKIVQDHLPLVKGTVYDLGCGTKPYEELLLEKADTYIGVDWSNTLHDIAQADIVADLNKKLPLQNNTADTVVSFQVMEHLSEPRVFLREAFRILKPYGNIILTVPFQWHLHEEPYDYYRYTMHGLRYLFEKAGFNNIRITPNTGYWTTRALKFNYHTERLTRQGIRGFVFKIIFIPAWILNQWLAPLLDKFDKDFSHTAGYTVTAQKITDES